MKILSLIALLGITLSGSLYAAKPKVVATTTMIGDLVREIAPDEVSLTVLMGPGVDPHVYRATASDLAALRSADIILYNGLKLEGRLSDLLERSGNRGRPSIAVTKGIDRALLLDDEDYPNQFDPHVWFDASLWAVVARTVGEALAEAVPAKKDVIAERTSALAAHYEELGESFRKQVERVPQSRRVLVTSHDAFSYFGRAYGFEVVGVQGLSTVTEAGLADMTSVVRLVRDRQLPAIFVESSVSPAAITRISEESGAKVGGELFSDALGSAGDMRTLADGQQVDVGTWEGMMRYNVDLIVEALAQ